MLCNGICSYRCYWYINPYINICSYCIRSYSGRTNIVLFYVCYGIIAVKNAFSLWYIHIQQTRSIPIRYSSFFQKRIQLEQGSANIYEGPDCAYFRFVGYMGSVAVTQLSRVAQMPRLRQHINGCMRLCSSNILYVAVKFGFSIFFI